MLEPSDYLAIHQLVELYGHVLDEREFSRVRELFTDDVVYDLSDFGGGVLHGVDEVLEQWRRPGTHPLAHHATNVVITEEADGTVHVVSKGIGVGPGGRVGSVTYRDKAMRTPDGWRLSHRTAALRRPETIPQES